MGRTSLSSLRLLQWGHRLSAMETFALCTPTALGSSAFNGATAFRRWKPEWGLIKGLSGIIPSMGPPPFGDGNFRGHRGRIRRLRTFNWATAFRRWKHLKLRVRALTSLSLQWGHRLSAMETPAPTAIPSIAWSFLQWGHRLSAMETVSALCQFQVRCTPPSMGPPPFGDGNKHDVVLGANALRVPSMGPPPFGDGNRRSVDEGVRLEGPPSMGPPPFGDGNNHNF